MTFRPARWPRFSIFNADNNGPKNPWGGGSGDTGGSGGGSGGTGGGSDGGPRNPWNVPPSGKKGRPGPSALDEFLKRARVGGPGGGGGGFGGGLPGGNPPRSIWAIGIGVLVLGWLLFTSFHSISPQERAVVTFLGRYSHTLQPGIQFTLPAPFNRVRKVDATIQTENFPENAGENLTLTGDQNLVDLAYSVRWAITNPQDFTFQIKEPTQTVRAAAESAMREVMATVTLDQAIGAGRGMVEGRVRLRMQEILDDYESGIRIEGVAINKAGPPSQVSNAFKDVTAAQQDAVAARNQAQAYAQQIVAKAEGEAGQFDRIYEQYRAAPAVTKRRLYYETMEDVLAKSNKTVIEAPGVTPYLPLPQVQRRVPEPDAPVATAPEGQR